jgi:hypothetical protein
MEEKIIEIDASAQQFVFFDVIALLGFPLLDRAASSDIETILAKPNNLIAIIILKRNDAERIEGRYCGM